MKPFVLLGLSLLLVASASQQKQSPCKGYPQDATCCKDGGGNWFSGASGGFCYMSFRSETGASQTDCKARGVLLKLSGGTFLCTPRGAALTAGKVGQVDEKAKTFTIATVNAAARGRDLPFHAVTPNSLPRPGQAIDVITTAERVMVCHRNGAGDMACCASDDDCFVYKNL